ncbi:hypothetical protein K7X08_013533 [Anisodus acutangulus]|uniref:DUF4220 domain-containing protein n=1 Tax=Anisodus acutangulus TaxID=402998 RepID=A0A9Q1LP15_9SOLA|nr:hypothetical protein K7X08_013533 [Anisodus acutangulus]
MGSRSADSSVISQNTLDKCQQGSADDNLKDELMSFWAPFMLLHFGGPDTITGSSWIPILSLLIFISGLIKFCERMCALRSAKTENLRDPILTPPDPGPNYAKFMEEFTLKKAEGFSVMAD